MAIRLARYISGVFFPIVHYVGDNPARALLDYQPIALYLELARQCLLDEVALDATLWAAWGVGWAVLFLPSASWSSGRRRRGTAVTEPAIRREVDLDAHNPEPAQAPPVSQLGDPSLIVDDLRHVPGLRWQAHDERRQPHLVDAPAEQGSRPGRRRHRDPRVRVLSFMGRQGESIGVIGRNGSGTSTLLRVVAGLIPPTKGAVYVSEEPSLLSVNAVLMSELTGERNIMIGGLALGLSPQQVRDRFDEVVEFAGIGDFVYLPMKAYSSEMGARLRFAISSAATPDVLLSDEALATGAAEFKAKSKDRIDRIRRQAGTIFLVSHSLATIESMCTRALWIDEGRLRMDGSAADVCTAYRSATKR